MHTHAVRHVRCGRPAHYRAFRAGPAHALVATADHMAYAALCGETVRIGSGTVSNVQPAAERGAEGVDCPACLAALRPA